MKVKVGVYQTPKPTGREGESLQHARVHSKGTRTMDDICEKIVPLGLNTAQLKGILDGLAVYIGESLRDGYHIELEDIGTFSLSVRTRQADDPEKMTVEVDGVNFKCSKKLKDRARRTELVPDKKAAPKFTPAKRKKQLLNYLQKNKSISIIGYTRLNNCSQYQAKKDIGVLVEEGVLVSLGEGTHKTYVIQL